DLRAPAARGGAGRPVALRGRRRRRLIPPAAGPGPWVVGGVAGPGGPGQGQGPEGIEHARQLVGALLADAGLDAARLGPVHEPTGVQRDRPGGDAGPLAAGEARAGGSAELARG